MISALSPEQQNRLRIYEALLVKWQKTINLVGPSGLANLWGRHFEDSLQLLPLAGDGWRNWVDFGSGGGFPGMVIAITAGGDGKTIHLVESDKRKVAFLREVSRETQANVRIHARRIESVMPELMERTQFDVVSARALAPLDKLVNFARPILEKGGLGLFLKGKDLAGELTRIIDADSLKIELMNSRTDVGGKIVVVRWHNSQTSSV